MNEDKNKKRNLFKIPLDSFTESDSDNEAKKFTFQEKKAKISSDMHKELQKSSNLKSSQQTTNNEINIQKSSNLASQETANNEKTVQKIINLVSQETVNNEKIIQKITNSTSQQTEKTVQKITNSLPLNNIIISISGISDRDEIKKIAKELGAEYSFEWLKSIGANKNQVLIVDASSDIWISSVKHKSALNSKSAIVDKSWLYACQNKKQKVPFEAYDVAFIQKKQQKISSQNITEKTSESTSKYTKEDEEEDNEPNEYVFDDFVVPDHYEEEEKKTLLNVKSLSNKPKINSDQPEIIFSEQQISERWLKWIKRFPQTSLTSNNEEVEFLKDEDSEGTNPIDPSEYLNL